MARRRRVLVWFAVGAVAALAAAEATARVAESNGPPALRWYDASTQLKVEQMDARGPAGVVFAGTSMVEQGMVPAVFTAADPGGRSAYNAALAGGVPVVMEPWLLEEVIPRLHPRVVVWGLSSMDLAIAYGEDNLARYRDALATRTGMLASLERAAAEVSALVRYRSILRRPSDLAGSGSASREAEFAAAAAILGDDGERLEFTVDVSETRAEQVRARLRSYRIDAADLEAIVRTVDGLRAEGVEVVFAEMPAPNRYVALHPNGAEDTARAHEAIRAIADLLDAPLIDLRYGFTDRDYVDYTHLDREAAAILTATLAGRLGAVDGPETTTTTTATTSPDPGAPSTTVPATTVPETTTTTAPPAALADAIATANRAIRVLDTVHHELLGGGNTLLTPAYWTSNQHLGKYAGLAARAGEGGFDVVMVGSSLVVSAFDPVSFAEQDGRSAFNAGVFRMGPEQVTIWLDSVLRLADPDLVLIGLAPRDVRVLTRVEGACVDSVTDWEWSEELRTRAFGPVDLLAGVYWETLLFGDPVDAALPSSYTDDFDELGGRTTFPENSPDEIDAAMEGGAWEGPFATCPERFDAVATEVAAAGRTGAEVVVVFMPISGNRAAMFEGGRAEIAGILGEIEQVAMAAGADAVIDLSALLPDDQFRDLAHADRDGNRAFTAALVAELARLGR